MRGESPFQSHLPAAPDMREPEHLHGMKDVKSYLLRRIQTDFLPNLQKINQSLKEHPETSPKRLSLLASRHAVLERAKQLQQAAKECDRFECHPWSYEAFLLEDLTQERAKDEPDQEHLNHLRGLLRAGSVLAKDTLSTGQEAHIVKTNAEALSLIGKAQRIEMEYWDWRLQMTSPRHVDPEAAGEIQDYREKELHELDLVRQAIERNTLSDALEPAIRTVEDIHGRLFQLYADAEQQWQHLPMNARGSADAKKAATQRNHWRDAYLSLRPLRDFLYYRRLYPVQAKASLVDWKPVSTTPLKKAV